MVHQELAGKPPSPTLATVDRDLQLANPINNPHTESYIVHIPKDQIYRTPPPENAYLIERYRRKQSRKKRSGPCPPCFSRFLAAVLLIMSIIFVVALVLFFVFRPRIPEFSVKSFAAVNSGEGQYNVVISTYNPSKKMSYVYGNGGNALLGSESFGNIASGEPPEIYQRYKNATEFNITLRGKSLNINGSSSSVDLKLDLEFPVKMEMGDALKLWRMELNVKCYLSMSSSTAKKMKVLWHQCGAKLRPRKDNTDSRI